MCGIAGMFERRGKRAVAETDMRQMLAMLRHRGPDEFGILLDEECGLGSARLSIIDLSGGTQPITNEDESLWIVFNGEVFNYIELRAELENQGHRFRTSSDTEVILHLYEEHGPACLDQLNGQWAIAIWNRDKRSLFLARDRVGVRPLFYTETADGALIFGSEIKSIFADERVSREIDPARVEEVFGYWAPLPSHTVFRGVHELPAAHYLIADEDGIEVRRYWDCEFKHQTSNTKLQGNFNLQAPIINDQSLPRVEALGAGFASAPTTNGGAEEEIIEQFRELLIDACQIRLRADVPVGAYLSGGLDSSTIASVVRRYMPNKLVTFSIAFTDDKFDESAFQQNMASQLGTEHHVVRASHQQIGDVFPDVVWHTEAPLMRTAPAPMFMLSKLVRDSGYKVVLTGEGADEFLAGYDIFKEAKVRRFWAQEPASKRRPQLLKRLYPDIGGLSESNWEMLAAFFGEGLSETESPWYGHAIRWRNNRRTTRFLRNPTTARESGLAELYRRLPGTFQNWEPLSRAQYVEITTFLSQYLLSSQGDRMGMAHSVEGRFPFLDVRLIEFCNRLDSRLKLRGLKEKYLLKKAAESWLPQIIRNRPKRPYRAPIHRSFFNSRTPDYVRELLSAAAIEECGFFKPTAIEQLVRKIDSGAAIGETDDMALAGILSTQLLHERFVKDFRRAEPLTNRDRVKVVRLNRPVEHTCVSANLR